MYCGYYYARIGGGGGTASVSRLLIVSRAIRRREFHILSSPSSSSLSIFSLLKFDGSTFPKNTLPSLAVAAAFSSSSSSSLTGNSVQHQLHQDDDDDDHNDGNDDRKVVSARSTNNTNTNISSILKQVRADLIEADVNHDGYIDYEELKLILEKYPNTFCHSDIDRIGNLFWVGRSGNSVRHSTFLKGIQHIMRNDTNDNNNPQHPKENDVKENPLQMTSLEDNRCWISPQEAKEEQGGGDFYNVQNQFDQSLSDYVQGVTTTTTTTTTTNQPTPRLLKTIRMKKKWSRNKNPNK